LPEVSLVAILDADKEGFLRNETSLIQTIGRAARNVNAKVLMYGDKVTDSMKRAIDETRRRRAIQEAYNKEHGITPQNTLRTMGSGIHSEAAAHKMANAAVGRTDEAKMITEEYISELQAEMLAAAESLEFERAASIRDRIEKIKDQMGKPAHEVDPGEAPVKKGRRGGGPRGIPGINKQKDTIEGSTDSRNSHRGKGKIPRPKQP
jgi:excinuclease ABC subunit B